MKATRLILVSMTLILSITALNNPDDLLGLNPFSIRKGYNEVVIFLDGKIQIFNVKNTETNPINDPPDSIFCISGEENGGIYLNGFYYTSCLKETDSNYFQIKIYDTSFMEKKVFPTSGTYYKFTKGTIRFFKIYSTEELIGVVWIDGIVINLIELNFNTQEGEQPKTITKVALARDIDCLYINKHERTVCLFGILSGDEGKYQANVNIFMNTNQTTNLKIINDCTNHHSRKIRLSTDAKTNSSKSDIFYYYYVDTNSDAYIMPLRLKSQSEISTDITIYKVMSGCDSNQHSYDIAEDKFLGYDVFICVEHHYKKTIKIHLFKIENNEIIFYRKNINNPYIYRKEEEISNSELSMINFIVLKESLNFGFLSYRVNQNKEAKYTIINQPTCQNFPSGNQNNELKQNQDNTFNFFDYIDNDYYDGVEVSIIPPVPDDIKITVSNNYKVKIKSQDYKKGNGEIEFNFKANNSYYLSEICTAKIVIKGCYKNCKECNEEGDAFNKQKCLTCKDNYIEIDNKLNDDNPINKNCCKDDCPNYFYLDKVDNIYKICDISCLAYKDEISKECKACYNKKELEKYSNNDIKEIKRIKGERNDNEYFFWKSEKHDKCIQEGTYSGLYLNETVLSYKECYNSCENCKGDGNELNNNCTECKWDNSNRELQYYHYKNKTSRNCILYDPEKNLYKVEDDGVHYLAECSPLCKTCNEFGDNNCISCIDGYYPICDKSKSKCYNLLPNSNFYFDPKKCYKQCDDSCKKCDKGPEGDIKNCNDCYYGTFLFNKNCITHCDDPYYELDGKTCLLECPSYTHQRPKDTDNPFNSCFNCIKSVDSNEKCIYLGTKLPDYTGKCVSCDLEKVFKCNEEYGILDDCYDLCKTCRERGTPEKMNCEDCLDDNHCIIKDIGNCIENNDNIIIPFYYKEIDEHEKCIYNKCYETCKTCSQSGNYLQHNCDTCKDNYQFDPSKDGNCVELCEFYWYIDPKTNNFTCTKEKKCPENLPYLTELNKGCVEQCSAAYHKDESFFYRYKNTCITKCPENSMKDNLLYACHSLDDVEDIFTYMSNYISQGLYSENLLLYSNDNKKYFHLFNTTQLGKEVYEKSAINVGTSIIDLSNCIHALKQIYGLTSNDVLYIGVLDIVRDDTSAPQFEYTIHNNLGTKLDINYCINSELKIQKSFNQSSNMSLAKDILAHYNYDIIDYNKDNPFFCDVCSLFDYDHLDSYDVLLNDRYEYYYNNQEYYFCEDNCNIQSTKIYLNESRVECICSGKGNFTSYQPQNFNRYQKYSQNCKDSYMQYFKCYKNVFNKNLFKNNIGNYFILFFIVSQIGTLLLFYLYSKKPMMSHIHDVLIKRAKKSYDKSSNSSYSHSGSYSDSRSGSESRSRTGSSRSGSRSGSKSNSNSNSNSRRDSKSGSEGSKSGSGSRSVSRDGSKKNDSLSGSFSGSKNSKANPPKKEKSKYAFLSIDNKEKEENKNNNDINNINNEENNNENKNNFLSGIEINNNEDKKNNEEEKNTTTNNNNIDNKNAPEPISTKYAKKFINNRNDYLDNSYREDSYNFDLPKQKKKKKGENGEEEEEEEEEEENEDQNGDNNEEGKNNGKNDDNKNDNDNGVNKPNKKGKKNKELPPAAAPMKTDLEKFQDEIKKFKKFSFFELYWFIIRKKHRILALIFKKDIYDIFSIKLSLLILSYTIDFFVTTFFFFESEIRKLFHKKKHIDPVYVIFMGIFCLLISTVLMRIVDYLMEYRMNFKKYEVLQNYENDRSNFFSSLDRMIKGFNHKMIIFYVINFAFSLLVWYMVSAFFATYSNTKLCWGIMLLINFVLSNIFPFIYYFIAVLLQYKGILKENFKLYKCGIIMLKI